MLEYYPIVQSFVGGFDINFDAADVFKTPTVSILGSYLSGNAYEGCSRD